MHFYFSLVTRLSSSRDYLCLCVRSSEGESLVYFDHVLDVVGRGYHFAADFAHAHGSIAGPRAHVHGRNRPLNDNHV